jgi:hypothetical protein
MANRDVGKASRAVVNPLPQAIRLVLSDSSERIVGPWGVVVLPQSAIDGRPLVVVNAEVVVRQIVISDDAA